MRTCSRASAPAPCGCGASRARRSSSSRSSRRRSCAGRSRSHTCSRSNGWRRSRKRCARPELRSVPVSAALTDDISEKYLQKAIAEINELGHELEQAAAGEAGPVLGSGHPLADVMLVKYAPQPSEFQEGVAFFGRAGQAVLKSLQRLRVDPMAIYGTNCIKFAGEREEDARPFLVRELHIVQPKLLVVMGDDALAFVNGLGFPLGATLESRLGELQAFTPTIEALVVPDIDASLDEQAAKNAFWNAFKQLGPWWA